LNNKCLHLFLKQNFKVTASIGHRIQADNRYYPLRSAGMKEEDREMPFPPSYTLYFIQYHTKKIYAIPTWKFPFLPYTNEQTA